jgi:hypothetical protein
VVNLTDKQVAAHRDSPAYKNAQEEYDVKIKADAKYKQTDEFKDIESSNIKKDFSKKYGENSLEIVLNTVNETMTDAESIANAIKDKLNAAGIADKGIIARMSIDANAMRAELLRGEKPQASDKRLTLSEEAAKPSDAQVRKNNRLSYQ